MTTSYAPSLRWAVSDCVTLVIRALKRSTRNVDALLTALMLPVFILLLFVYVFGGAVKVGVDYVDYVVPGTILLCAGFGSATTAVSVCQDMTDGAIDRFRALPIANAALLIGHVTASVLRNLVTTALVIGLALLIGFTPHAGVIAWLEIIGLLVLFMSAVAWLAACFGLLTREPEAANAFTFIAMFLPYVSSAFVPTRTMPEALRVFAAHQPATPVIETLRGLMMGTGASTHAAAAAAAGAWCGGGVLLGSMLAAWLYRRRTAT